MQEIADDLNVRGLRNTRGTKLNINTVSNLLTNRKYMSEYSYREIVVPDGIPTIVPKDLFVRVQERIAKNKKSTARYKAEAEYILSTKLYCGRCMTFVVGESWTAMQQLVGAMPCASYGVLADMGYIIGCESDMHATMTQVLLKCLTFGEKKPFLGEFTTRHPENRNAELLWHCGPFAHSLHRTDESCKCINMREWFQVKRGHYTVARIDQDHGKYSIIAGECDSTEGPYTFGTYMWAQFNNLSAWERKLVEGPYIHHVSEIEGSLTDEIREVCKYMPALKIDTVG